MIYASKSITGKRAHNEDSFFVPDGAAAVSLLAVADGMGGHAAGDVASRMTIEGLAADLSRLDGDAPADAIRQAIRRINLEVFRAAQANPSCRGMGSTLVCALIEHGRYIAANVGDSRLYHFDGDTLECVTTDHSLVEALVAEGAITRAEALTHPMRNVITRAVGSGFRVDVDIFDRSWKEGDILLLCSDGLHGSLSDDDMCAILCVDASLQTRCDALVSAAFRAGSRDNITAVLALCEGGDRA